MKINSLKKSDLAVFGGDPVRQQKLPYGRQSVDEADIQSVVDVLRSGWLTTGPMVSEFEQKFSNMVGSQEAVALSSGTAALHAAMYAIGIQPGDEVIIPSMTFAASANCVLFLGGKPVFIDIDLETFLIDSQKIEAKITPRTKAIIAIDFAGQPCDYEALSSIAKRHKLYLISDACHSLGGKYQGRPVGSLADLNAFSFHPVKPITTGEGGMVTTNNPEWAKRMRLFRNHGISTDVRQREHNKIWFYEMVDLGFNYRLSDIQCALGLSQLKKLPGWIQKRNDIAKKYHDVFSKMKNIRPLKVRSDVLHAYHLYVVEFNLSELTGSREDIYKALIAEGIGVNVHYIPVHLHPFYQKFLKTRRGLCPVAEEAYERILSLPMFPSMADRDVKDVIIAVEKVLGFYQK